MYLKFKSHWDIDFLAQSLILFINTSFCLGKYDESYKWLNFLEREIPQTYVLPYQNMGKIAHLLIHNSLGNDKMVQNMLESTRIRLYRKFSFFSVANTFLKYFKRKVKCKTDDAQKKLLIQYKEQMQVVSQKKEQKGFFILFNFVDWFDAEIQNCSIVDLNTKF